MDALELTLDLIVGNPSQFKPFELPQIAFIGRSNVGKSSLINLLAKKKKVAHISSSPGKTKTINFYKTQYPFYLIDMPGFGYAKIAKQTKAGWEHLIETYFKNFGYFIHLFILVDSRHELQKSDIEFWNKIKSYPFEKIVIMTKIDQAGQKDISASLTSIKKQFNLMETEWPLIKSSSKTGEGKKEILSVIQQIMKAT